MAETGDDTERSEDPTQKRLDEALKRGDGVKSQEVNTWFVIAGAALILLSFSNAMSSGLTGALRGLIAKAHSIPMDCGGLRRTIAQLGLEIIAAFAIPLLLLTLAAIAGNMIQHRLVWSGESLKPKLSKISLAGGAKRLFSKVALANFLKGLVKIALIGAVMAVLLWPKRYELIGLVAMDPRAGWALPAPS